jgi:hypothetical protein
LIQRRSTARGFQKSGWAKFYLDTKRIAEDHAALKAAIPDDFWRELRKQSLVAPTAPLPIDK